jgi:hypothetical protein
MRGGGRGFCALGLCALLTALAQVSPARAAEEEIQVYMDEMDKPGQFGLDVHNNYTLSGSTVPDSPGAQIDAHRYRMTPEFSYGLTPNIELGAYLPLTTIDNHGSFSADGVKLRVKWIAPKPEDQTWFWGANLEIGEVNRRLDINPWNGELKGILGGRFGPWTVAMNGNLDFVISGPHPDQTLDFDTKVSYRIKEGFAVGVETYNGAGPFREFGDFAHYDESIYAVIDASLGKWDLNLGAGHGYGGSEDGWVLKAIVSVPIDG